MKKYVPDIYLQLFNIGNKNAPNITCVTKKFNSDPAKQINYASKSMLLLIYDISKALITGKKNIQATFYVENKSLCVCFFTNQ